AARARGGELPLLRVDRLRPCRDRRGARACAGRAGDGLADRAGAAGRRSRARRQPRPAGRRRGVVERAVRGRRDAARPRPRAAACAGRPRGPVAAREDDCRGARRGSVDRGRRRPPRHGEVLVRVEAAAVNHFDITQRLAPELTGTTLPYTPGRDAAGRRVDTGERVLVTGAPGTYAEFVAAPAETVRPIPDSLEAA